MKITLEQIASELDSMATSFFKVLEAWIITYI